MTFKRRSRGRITLLALLTAVCVIMGTVLTAWSDDRLPFPKPASHKGAWINGHGITAQVSANDPAQTGRTCLVCHEKNDCIACHATRPPLDHTNYWRTTGHGMAASVNRERCLNCHRQDYCVRCHNETAPRSHTAGWVNRHCQWCHQSGGVPDGNCGVCHKRSPH
jgi:hypothetical protein